MRSQVKLGNRGESVCDGEWHGLQPGLGMDAAKETRWKNVHSERALEAL
jgi:hypothetical protein